MSLDDWVPEEIEVAVERGHEQGLRQGMAQQRALLVRQAALRFDADTAESATAALDKLIDPERLAGAGEAIVQCKSGEDLKDRLTTIAATMGLEARIAKWCRRWQKMGVQEGWEQGLAAGLAQQRRLLSRQADLRFGSETAARVAAALERATHQARLAEAGEAVLRCASGDELVERLTWIVNKEPDFLETGTSWLDELLQGSIQNGRSQGIAEGLAQQRALLSRQAELQFDEETAARVSDVLERTADAERLATAGEAIVQGLSGDELIYQLVLIVIEARQVTA